MVIPTFNLKGVFAFVPSKHGKPQIFPHLAPGTEVTKCDEIGI